MALTVAGVARIKPPKDGQIDYPDGNYAGLALRVGRSTKTWTFVYRIHGKQRRLTIGRYPAMGLTEAREAWRVARLAVAKGEDPAHARPTAADSFAVVANEWLERDQAENRSVAEVRRTIGREVIPVWGDRPITSISRRDVLERIDAVVDRDAKTMARRLHSHLSRLFKWAVGRGILTASPMTHLPKPGEAIQRDRVLAGDELAAVWKAAKQIGWPFGPAIQLLIATAARRDEVASLRWSEIQGDKIKLPGERTKNGEPHIIPLTPAMTKLIQGLQHIGAGDGFVFTTNGRTAVSGWSKAKKAIDAAAAEILGRPLVPWRLHDLRRSAATGMQRLGVQQQVVEALLNHISGSRAGIVGIYQRHKFEDEKRAALTAWGHEIERLTRVGGHSFAPPAAQLTITTYVPSVEMKPANVGWAQAVTRADKETSPEPLLDYFRRQPPGATLEPADILLLQDLLERMNFTRKDSGRFVPMGEKSRAEIHKLGAEHVRKLKQDFAARGKKLSSEKAAEITVQARPDLFPDGESEAFLSHIRRSHHH